MPPVGFEPTISAGERPQTYALNRAATGTGRNDCLPYIIHKNSPLPLFTIPSPIFLSRYMTDIPFTITCKGKEIPLQAWTGPEVSRKLSLPDFKAMGI